MKNIIITAFFIFSCFEVNFANANLKIMAPLEVCTCMEDAGLSTGGWKNYWGKDFACLSAFKDIGSGFPSANGIQYTVDGDKDSVTQVFLLLNVYHKSQAASAHSAMLSLSEALSIKATGAKLPQSIKNAIIVGKASKAKIGQSEVEVLRVDWPTGKGYELRVIFK